MLTMHPIVPMMLGDGTELPRYANPGDAGLDLCSTEDVKLRPGEWKMVGSGVRMAIPMGYVGIVVPRSGLGCKGLVLKNTCGIIDAGFRGEVMLPLFNNNPTHVWTISPSSVYYTPMNTDATIHVHKGDRVAQLLIMPVAQVVLKSVGSLDETDRNTGSFGSSGVRGERL